MSTIDEDMKRMEERRRERQASIEKDTIGVCIELGIDPHDDPAKTSTHRVIHRLARKLVQKLSAVVHGLNGRISQNTHALARQMAATNQAYNATQCYFRALTKRLVEKGIYESPEELERELQVAAQELYDEATAAGGEPDTPVDKISAHIDDLIRGHQERVSSAVSEGLDARKERA